MKKTIIKVAVIVVLFWIVSLLQNAYQPLLVQDVALRQLENSDSSFSDMQTVNHILKYAWLLYVVIPFLVFFPEIKKAVSKKQQ